MRRMLCEYVYIVIRFAALLCLSRIGIVTFGRISLSFRIFDAITQCTFSVLARFRRSHDSVMIPYRTSTVPSTTYNYPASF